LWLLVLIALLGLIAAAAALAAILIGATVPPLYVGYGNFDFFLKMLKLFFILVKILMKIEISLPDRYFAVTVIVS
jgi:hypothetical protein